MSSQTKTGIINIVLWIAFILAMASSIQHLASTFGTTEQPGREWLGWIPAVAVDAGLAALAYTIQQRKKAKRPTAILWGGVAGFAIISALANLYHALAVEAVANAVIGSFLTSLGVQIAKAVILSASLPIMYIFLGEIVSGDDAAVAKASEQAAEREQARADREARRSELEADRALAEEKRKMLEAETAALMARQAETEAAPSEFRVEASEPLVVACDNCGRNFRSINARNAHKCESRALVATVAALIPLNGNGKTNA